MTPRSRAQGERGAAALSLLTVGILVAIGIFAAMAIPLTDASDAKAKSRSAADAAALAGVESIRVSLRDAVLAEGGFPGGGFTELLSGVTTDTAFAARDYAERNDGTLVLYTPPGLDNGWTAYAKVRGREVDGQENISEARAQLDLPECNVEETTDLELAAFTRAEPDEDEDDDEDDPPEPTFGLTCGGVDIIGDGADLADLPGPALDKLLGVIDDSNAKLIE